MHAEQAVSTGQAYGIAALVAGGATVSPSGNAALISTDSNDSGLWLWHGEAPPQLSRPRPKLGARRILRRIAPAAGWAGWIALPAGLAILLIAASMMPHSENPVSADAPAVALSSAPSFTVEHSSVVVPQAELNEVQLDHVPVPLSPTAKSPARGLEQRIVKSGAQRKSSRKITHAAHVRRGPPVPMRGVLTPPPMTWHGGGY
jgi:hypothetical protein